MTFTRFVLASAALIGTFVQGQPPSGGSGGGISSSEIISGSEAATGCSPAGGTTCAKDGSSNYHSFSIDYNTTTGKFNGSITTNLCEDNAYGYVNGTYSLPDSALSKADCIKQTIPGPDYASTPVASTLRGRVGLTISGAVNIYGPLEAGFTSGQVCTGGTCPSGIDLGACSAKLQKECSSSSISWYMLPDDCGGHADPYHLHWGLGCDYNATNSSTHSPLVGIALDGRGIYGKWESSGATPTDLDACNGHYGDVPAYSDSEKSYAAATNVYHYHVTDGIPYTLGCYGPVTSISHCKTLYSSTCDTGYECMSTVSGKINYDTDCPCYQQNGTTYNQDYTSTCTVTSAGEYPQGIKFVALIAMLALAIFSIAM